MGCNQNAMKLIDWTPGGGQWSDHHSLSLALAYWLSSNTMLVTTKG